MINEQRVRLMTKMSIYEKTDGIADEKINGYFKSDYIGSQFLHSFICATITFVLLVIVVAFYNFEELMLTVYSMDLSSFVFRVIAAYIIFLAVFLFITYLVYSWRYDHARKHLNRYYRELKRLSASYHQEEDE
ncbi:hypothetical protein SAMN02745687_00703 [Lachnospiraceae bacterium NK3A20]|jgi:hypothetical protein|nr:hypothetical protein SAMN02745687_00703 [Lachnospiraceae bacterium NK3A20]